MSEQEQASVVEGDTTVVTDEEIVADEEKAVDPKTHKQLADKHAQLGRELKAEREARVKAEQDASDLKAEREKARYEQMNDDEKAEYRRKKDEQDREAPKTANLTNERDLLQIIASNDDPKITKALSALYWRSQERGRYPDKDAVLAIVEGLTPDDTEEDKAEDKKDDKEKPPKVTASRGTRGTEPSAEQVVSDIETSLKKKDGKFSYIDLLAARQRVNSLKRTT